MLKMSRRGRGPVKAMPLLEAAQEQREGNTKGVRVRAATGNAYSAGYSRHGNVLDQGRDVSKQSTIGCIRDEVAVISPAALQILRLEHCEVRAPVEQEQGGGAS